MNIIFFVLEELKYISKSEFEVIYELKDERKKAIVTPFVSTENSSQVFLTLFCKNIFLNDVVNSNLVREIAFQFRKKDYHKAEMDRNTTLLILSEHAVDEVIDTFSKVKIEDDPYYFKKYVFSYDELSEKKTEAWIEQNKDANSLVTVIQDYVANTNKFTSYKIRHQNEPVYTFLVELITKVPIFPIKIVESQNLRSIEQYLNDEIESMKSGKKRVEIRKIALEQLANTDFSDFDIKEICKLWEQCM